MNPAFPTGPMDLSGIWPALLGCLAGAAVVCFVAWLFSGEVPRRAWPWLKRLFGRGEE